MALFDLRPPFGECDPGQMSAMLFDMGGELALLQGRIAALVVDESKTAAVDPAVWTKWLTLLIQFADGAAQQTEIAACNDRM